MKVSVIIPTLPKNREYLKLCVESLRETVDWDIIVVSNGEEMKPVYKDIHGITRHIHTARQGQCRAVNIGAQMVAPDTDYIMVSNDDMYYAEGWNDNLRFNNLCFSPNLIEPTNNSGSAKPFLKLDAGFTLEEFDAKKVKDFVWSNSARASSDTNPYAPTGTTGFNLPFFIRRDVWDTIRGYDEKYDPWGSNSDTDLQTKIELAGVQPMRLRDVLVYHFSNKSGTFDGTHQAEWQTNWDYYTKKWGFNRDDEPKPDTWMATDMVNKEKNIYHPDWEGKYEDS